MMIIVVPRNWAGSQWRLHPLPAADRTVPGSTPSRRRATQDDPISGGKGVRRHCGRNTGIAVALMQEKMQECKSKKTSNQDRPTHQTKNTNRTETPPREPNTDHNPARTATRKTKKKTQERVRNLGVGVGDEVRIEDEDRGQDEETQGDPNPKWVWVSPAPERERKRENVVGEQTTQTKKERGHKHQSEQGAGLEGHQTKQHINPQDQENRTKNHTNTQETPNKKNKHQAYRVSGELSQQGGGAHGPPCTRGPWYRGVRRPPHHGNRPRWRKNKQHAEQ